jgi:CO/xanthine dehydrogenase FAD-binding subunit
VRIGATATLTSLLEQDDVPLLRDAARRTASWSIRNMGTVGGNLFTPPPGGDVATALLALDAVVELTGPGGTRRLALEAFHTGFMTTALAPDELVTAIIVPFAPGRHSFVKFGRKAANTPAIVTVAVHAKIDDDAVTSVRIAIGAAGPHPLRARGAEMIATGTNLAPDVIAAAGEAALADAEPFTDALASAWYRQRMVPLMVRRALADIAGVVETGLTERGA